MNQFNPILHTRTPKKPGKRKVPWTDQEIEYLKAHYPGYKSMDELVNGLNKQCLNNRSKLSVRFFATQSLKLKRA